MLHLFFVSTYIYMYIYYCFTHFFLYSLLLVVSYLFSSSSLYFLPIFFRVFVYIFLTFISFFLSSDTLFPPSFINVG
jgi:hypothetical protein